MNESQLWLCEYSNAKFVLMFCKYLCNRCLSPLHNIGNKQVNWNNMNPGHGFHLQCLISEIIPPPGRLNYFQPVSSSQLSEIASHVKPFLARFSLMNCQRHPFQHNFHSYCPCLPLKIPAELNLHVSHIYILFCIIAMQVKHKQVGELFLHWSQLDYWSIRISNHTLSSAISTKMCFY